MRKLVPGIRFGNDLDALDKSVRNRMEKAIGKIQQKPELGKPLGNHLSGYFSEHVGGYRIIYRYDSDFVYLERCRKRNLGY